MARNIDESDQDYSDLEPQRSLTRRERRAMAKAGVPHQSRGEDDTPVTDAPDAASPEEQVEEASAPGVDVVPTTARGRKRWVPALILVIVLALVAAGGVFWWQRQNAAAPPAPAPAAEDQTLFVSLTTGDGGSAGGMLLIAHQSEAYGVLVPADLTLDAPSVGTTTIRAAQAAGPDVPGQAVADATAVPVDGHWVFSFDGLAALVDAVGGVTVDVDVPVQVGEVTLSPGEQELTGGQAATYAGWSVNGEARIGQLVRAGQVVHAVIGALPSETGEVATVLGRASGETTLDTAELAGLLSRVRAAQVGGSFGGSIIPTTPIPSADNPDAVALDVPAFSDWLTTVAPGLQGQQPGEAGRAQVLNAADIDNLQDPARGLLLREAFTYTFGGPAAPIRPASIVMYSPARGERATALAAARTLGLDDSAVQPSEDVPLDQDVVILLGEDFAVAQGLAVPGQEAPAEGDEPAAAEGGAAEDAPAQQPTEAPAD